MRGLIAKLEKSGYYNACVNISRSTRNFAVALATETGVAAIAARRMLLDSSF
jgi:hypothetical protein